MNSHSTGRSNSASQRTHLSVSSQPQTNPINDRDPRDGFDYQDQGPSNTPSKKRREEPLLSSASQASTDSGAFLHTEQLTEKLEAVNIYERGTRGTRARYSDDDYDSIKPNTILPTRRRSSRWSSKSQRPTRHDQERRNDKVALDPFSRPAVNTKLRHVLLNWRTHTCNGTHRTLLEVLKGALNSNQQRHKFVVWQHSNFDNMKLDELETMVAQLRNTGLQDGMLGLTKRLIKRVQLISERPFVGGSFLKPAVTRYDMLNDSRLARDKSCAFLNFPYFLVKKAEKGVKFVKGDTRHPTRTLLQSRYRLNETTERDKSQCIRMLDAKSLESCIEAPGAESRPLTRRVDEDLIYVPQLWALIMGRDHLLTAGPTTDQALQGSELEFRDSVISDACTLVRISFMNQGIREDVAFPLQQCATWFGLLNKHQQIRSALSQGKEIAAPKEYRLRIGDHILSDITWASVQQKAADGPMLNLWMDTPKPPRVTVRDANGDSASEASQISDYNDEPYTVMRTASTTSADFEKLGRVPVVKAFLEWRIVDDFGENDKSLADRQTDYFLENIYSTLGAACASTNSDPTTPNTIYTQNSMSGRDPRPKISVVGKTSIAVDALSWNLSHQRTEQTIEQKLYWDSTKLLGYFVSDKFDKTSPPIQLYWGLLYELIVRPDPCL
ncbi:MAG: hypothetical protein Q9218_003682 [Villophora microphyllina]